MQTILLIEDDSAIHDLIKEFLEQNDFHVMDAYSGTEGQLLFDQQKIDLVLLDLMLPGMSGNELLKKMREKSRVPIIVVSAKKDLPEKVDLLKNGADDYLIKPFDLEELLARVRIQLRHATNTAEEKQELSYKDVEVDLETREVSVAGKKVQLTAREYELLLLFLDNPHKVFSRRNIYESIWQEPYFNSDKTINVHVSNLRGKLNSEATDYIKTVWGVGFKFD